MTAYVFQEYPKALYRKGEYACVHDGAEEIERRAEGFDGWHADQAAIEAAQISSGGGAGETKVTSSKPRAAAK